MPGSTFQRSFSRTFRKPYARPFSPASSPQLVLGVSSVVFGTQTTNSTGPLTSSSFTPTSTDAIVFVAIRKSVSTAFTGAPALTIGGVAATQLDFADITGAAGNPLHFLYYIRGLTPNIATTAVWAGNGITLVGKMICALVCLSNWQGNIGAHNCVGSHPASQTAGPTATATPLLHTNSLMLGMGFGTDPSTRPFTASGFTALLSMTSGSAPSNGMTVFSKTGGASGGSQSISPVAAAPWTDFGSALVEVY